VKDEKWGEVGKAFIVAKDNSLKIDLIKVYCQQKLAKYKIPKYFELMEDLPKNDTGKIDRKALKIQ
ncbi:MAG: AMP-dependent synthetase, partial [Bacteroidota bacterium]